jgi:putative transcriptional regulator
MITHHPPLDSLVDYASGAMPEPLELLIAAHLSLCPACRAQAGALEDVGGALLDSVPPSGLMPGSLENALARLDEPAEVVPPLPQFDVETERLLPAPLRHHIGVNLADCRWRWRGPSMRETLVPVSPSGWRVGLFRVRPGGEVPSHTHAGHEYTLVLAGGLTDRSRDLHIVRGDVEVAGSDNTHVQVADGGEECLCLAVLDAPVILKGALGRLANPFLRF